MRPTLRSIVKTVTLAACAACLDATSARAQEASSSCPISPSTAPEHYERLHQIPTTPDQDDVAHKMVTPGGMVMDTPKMVAATDRLTIVSRDHATLCFHLLTFARDRRKCELSGVAHKESGNTFLFRREENAVVRLTFLRDDQVKIEPAGTSYRQHCEPFGQIQPAIYERITSAD